MIDRPEYLKKLQLLKHTKVIKVITGIRRCGKSTMFELFQKKLEEDGVKKSQIQSINFENLDNADLLDYKHLHLHIKENLIPEEMNYVFLDEIQSVVNFEKAVDSLYLLKNVDIYITGSNAYLLSGELATLLSGRYVTINMQPLSFSEYISSFDDQSDLSRKYRDYLNNSSFPYAIEFNGSQELMRDYLGGLYDSIILKDIVKRKNISDVSILESVIRFMFHNIGSLVSIKKISDTMTSDGRKISTDTVENYLSAMTDSYILYKVGRYNIQGRQYLKSGEKYYVADIGLRYFLLGSRNVDTGHILENIVYLELIRRGYNVYIGKINAKEVDFVVQRNGNIEYYQVAQTVLAEETLNRELSSLNAISDHHPKYLITLDDTPVTSHNGIKQIYALDWLLGEKDMIHVIKDKLKSYLEHSDFEETFNERIKEESPLYKLVSKNKRSVIGDAQEIGKSLGGQAQYVVSKETIAHKIANFFPRFLVPENIQASLVLYGQNSMKTTSDIIETMGKKISERMEDLIINGHNGVGGIGGKTRASKGPHISFPRNNTIIASARFLEDSTNLGLSVAKIEKARSELAKKLEEQKSIHEFVLVASQYALETLMKDSRYASIKNYYTIIASELVQKGIQMYNGSSVDAVSITGEYAYIFDPDCIILGEGMSWNFLITDSFYIRGLYDCSRKYEDGVIRIEVAHEEKTW